MLFGDQNLPPHYPPCCKGIVFDTREAWEGEAWGEEAWGEEAWGGEAWGEEA